MSLRVIDKQQIISSLLDFHMFVKVKCAMDQYIDGLSSIGLGDRITQNPSIWEPMFTRTDSELTPGTGSLLLQCNKCFFPCRLFKDFFYHLIC
jgi:phenylalanine-4-hydroxylase